MCDFCSRLKPTAADPVPLLEAPPPISLHEAFAWCRFLASARWLRDGPSRHEHKGPRATSCLAHRRELSTGRDLLGVYERGGEGIEPSKRWAAPPCLPVSDYRFPAEAAVHDVAWRRCLLPAARRLGGPQHGSGRPSPAPSAQPRTPRPSPGSTRPAPRFPSQSPTVA